MRRRIFPMIVPVLFGLSLSGTALAQDHSGHQMPSPPVTPVQGDEDPHAGHDMSAHTPAPAPQPPAETDPHAGHNMHDMASMPQQQTEAEIGSAPPPKVPTDHAADALFDPVAMEQSRALIRKENGGLPVASVSFDLAEIQFRKGHNGYRWEGEAWFGGDINRLTLKYEGEGSFGGAVEDAEVQALWSRALDPYWNLQAGVRYDIKPNPSRTYLALGIEGLAPYWFELGGMAFVSDKGDVHVRAEGHYDQRITQHLILQPRLEVNFAMQDVPATGVGSGLSDFELGLRLRYEIHRKFAPYIGVEWQRETGDTARFTRAAGDDPSVFNVVLGIKTWF